MPDDSSHSDKRRNERVAANFSVAFREISEAEAEQWAALDTDDAPHPDSLHADAPHTDVPHADALHPDARRAGEGSRPGSGPAAAPLAGQTVNLSQGGLSMTGDLQLLGDHRMARGSKVLVEFSLPGEHEKVRCAAVVAWSLEGKGEKGKFTAGLMFMGMRPLDLEKISKYVEHSQ